MRAGPVSGRSDTGTRAAASKVGVLVARPMAPERKREMWQKDLERWFENGPDDPDVVLIKVSARHIDAWAGEDEYSFDVR